MRIQIHNILLGLLLLHPVTHHALAADETENVANVKALVTYALSPQYPYEARAKRQTGSGVATLVIDPKTGFVTTAEMARSTGSQVLDNAALSAFRRWRFRPGLVTKANIPITFTMDGGVELMVREIKDVDASLAPFLGRGMVLSAPQPRYPLRPPWTNKQGKGIYEMHVGRDGKVEDVRILKSSGDTTFDSITVSALRKWRLRRGPMIVELPLAFKLTPLRYDFWVAER